MEVLNGGIVINIAIEVKTTHEKLRKSLNFQ